MLEQARQAATGWKAITGRDIGISVNVSPRQFRDSGFINAVMRALSNNNLVPQLLELEITERLLLDNSIETTEILRELDRAGIRLSGDDSGTG